MTVFSIDGQGLSSIADNIFFVLFVYLLVIGVWSLACNVDFISVQWKSVKKTRQRGLIHFIVITLPMAYILSYIFIQAKTGDFKEVGAASVALVFACLHLLRTSWGLWQLYEFKRWAIASIKSVQSLDPKIGEGKDPEQLSKTGKGIDPEDLADLIDVNDTIIDNRLMEGLVRCNLRFITPPQARKISEKSKLKQYGEYLKQVAISATGIPSVIYRVLFDIIKDDISLMMTPYIEPNNPEELWLRWASVLVSDAIPDWLEFVSTKLECIGTEDIPEFKMKRDRFAEEVLIYSSTHVQKYQTPAHRSKTDIRHCFVPYNTMYEYEKLSNGQFSKEEFLRKSIVYGKGLPFSAPHRSARDEDNNFSYAKFESKLKRVIDSLPADRHEKAKNLGICEIEWLAVFLSLKSWSPLPESKGMELSVEPRYMEQDDENDPLEESDFPVINLANQLGFIGEGGSKKIEQQFSFPLLKHSKNSFLWGNRNLLECSIHVDNWIAIKSGSYIKNMGLEMKDVAQHYWKFDQNKKLEYDRNRFQQLFMAPFDEHFEQTLTFMGASMESLRSLLAQWTLDNEVLQRSGWAPKIIKESYPFAFEPTSDFKDCMSRIKYKNDMKAMSFQMRLLWELQNFFRANMVHSKKGPQDENSWAMCILSFPALSFTVSSRLSSEYIILELEEESVNNEGGNNDEFNPYEYQVLIKPEGLPSSCEIIVKLDSECLNIQLRKNSEYIRFNWEDWRDAFQGRLEGLRKWQLENWCSSSMGDGSSTIEKHGLIRAESQIEMDNIRFPIYSGIVRKKLMGAGIGDYLTIWKGWLPHKRNMCHFELTSKDLIKTRKTLDREAQQIRVYGKLMTIQCPQIQYKSEKYSECHRESLQRCTVISAAAIRKLSSGGKEDDHSLEQGLGKNLRKLADRMTGNTKNRNCTVSMTMYETAAVYYGDRESLEKALDILYSEEKYTQASTLIELFFYSKLARKKILFTKENPDAGKLVKKVRDLFESCITKAGFSSEIAVQYAQLCLYLSNLGHNDCIENAKNILQRVFLQSSGSSFNENILQCIKLYCDLLVCTEHTEDLDMGKMIMEKMRDFANTVTETHENGGKKGEFIAGLNYLDTRLLYRDEVESKVEEMGKELEFALARLFHEKADNSMDDVNLARHLYEMSARNGHKGASYNLAIMLQSETDPAKQDILEAKKYFEKAFADGCYRSAFKLARMLQFGEGDVEKNIQRSVYYYWKAVNAGYLKAAINLGNIYRKGKEVEQNICEAINLFRQASEAGHTKGTFALICILKGDEGEQYKSLKDAASYLNTAFEVIRNRNDINDTESIKTSIENVKEMLEENGDEDKIGQLIEEILAGLKNIYSEANKK